MMTRQQMLAVLKQMLAERPLVREMEEEGKIIHGTWEETAEMEQNGQVFLIGRAYVLQAVADIEAMDALETAGEPRSEPAP